MRRLKRAWLVPPAKTGAAERPPERKVALLPFGGVALIGLERAGKAEPAPAGTRSAKEIERLRAEVDGAVSEAALLRTALSEEAGRLQATKEELCRTRVAIAHMERMTAMQERRVAERFDWYKTPQGIWTRLGWTFAGAALAEAGFFMWGGALRGNPLGYFIIANTVSWMGAFFPEIQRGYHRLFRKPVCAYLTRIVRAHERLLESEREEQAETVRAIVAESQAMRERDRGSGNG